MRIKGERMSWVLAIPALSVPGLGALLMENPLHPLDTRRLDGFGGGLTPAAMNTEPGGTSVLRSSVSQEGRQQSPHT